MMSVSIKTISDFTLTITLRPESTVTWDKYLEPSGSNEHCGYTDGNVIYGDDAPPKSFVPSQPGAEYAVIKGKPVKFKVNMLSSEEYKVSH